MEIAIYIARESPYAGNMIERRGFSLMELLVVITIIGLLLAVIMASFSMSRQRARASAVQSNLLTAQLQAEVFFFSARTYGPGVYSSVGGSNCATLTTASPSIWNESAVKNALIEATSQSGANVQCRSTSANSQQGGIPTYAIQASLPGGGYFCVDSFGRHVVTQTALGGSQHTVCPTE